MLYIYTNVDMDCWILIFKDRHGWWSASLMKYQYLSNESWD